MTKETILLSNGTEYTVYNKLETSKIAIYFHGGALFMVAKAISQLP